MSHDEMKQAFLLRIKKEPENDVHRYVFADWLEENGFDDEALLQREWTVEKYTEALAYLEEYAIETEMLVEQLLAEATNYLQTKKYAYLPFDTPEIAGKDQTKFWECYQTVTGIPVSLQYTEDERMFSWFRCSC